MKFKTLTILYIVTVNFSIIYFPLTSYICHNLLFLVTYFHFHLIQGRKGIIVSSHQKSFGIFQLLALSPADVIFFIFFFIEITFFCFCIQIYIVCIVLILILKYALCNGNGLFLRDERTLFRRILEDILIWGFDSALFNSPFNLFSEI